MVKDISQLSRDEITALAEADHAAVPQLRKHGDAWAEAARLARHVQSTLESRMSERLGTSDTAAVRSLLKQIGGTGKSAVSLASSADRRASTLSDTADEAERLKTAVDRLNGEAAEAAGSHAADPDIAFQGYNGISDPDAGYQAYLSDVTEDMRSEVRLSSEAYEGQARRHHDAPVDDFAGPGEWTGPMPERMPQPVPTGDGGAPEPGRRPIGGGETGGYSDGGSHPAGSTVGATSGSVNGEPELQTGPGPVTTSPAPGPAPIPSGGTPGPIPPGGTPPGPVPIPGAGPGTTTPRPVTPPATGRPIPGGTPPATGPRPTPGLPGSGPRPAVPVGSSPTTGTRPTTGVPSGLRPPGIGPHSATPTGRPGGNVPTGPGSTTGRPGGQPLGARPPGIGPHSATPTGRPGGNVPTGPGSTTGRPGGPGQNTPPAGPRSTTGVGGPTPANPRPMAANNGAPSSTAASRSGANPPPGSKAERALLPNQRPTGGTGPHGETAASRRVPGSAANPGRPGPGGLTPNRSTVPPVLGGRGGGPASAAAARPELNRGSLTGLRSGRPGSRTGKPRPVTATGAAGKVIGARSRQGSVPGPDDRDALRLRAETRRRFLNEIDDRKALSANDSELLRGIETTVVPGVITSSSRSGPVRRGQIGRVFGTGGWQG